MQTNDTKQVRWLDDGTTGTAVKEREDGIWLGTWTVYTRNAVTGGTREDKGAVLGLHVVELDTQERALVMAGWRDERGEVVA